MKPPAESTSAPVPWKRVAVFVSSTFSDMHAERDYLVKRVFPDLHDWCERRRLRLVDVDLRWGVTEADATENRNVVQTCLKRIDECRPFFLCFVGQRRGSVPMPQEINPRTLDAFPELRQHLGKASVTELEILHAILQPLHGDAPREPAREPDYYRPADHAFFYLRAPSYLGSLPADPPELMAAYANTGGDDPARRDHDEAELRRWREVEIPRCGRPVHHYSAKWNPALSTPELALPLACPASTERRRERWRKRWARAGVGLAPDGLRVADEEQAHEFNRRLTAGRLSGFSAVSERCSEFAQGTEVQGGLRTPCEPALSPDRARSGCVAPAVLEESDTRPEARDLDEIILDDLKRGISARYPDHVEVEGKPGSLQAELDQQEQFLFVNSEGFIERGHDFDELDEYVRGDSRKLFVLTAEGGMGKSMLLANWIDRCRAAGSPLAGTPFLFRFVGQSDGSTTAANVQSSLLTELREVHGRLPETVRVKEERQGPPGAASESVERDVPLEIPGDPNKLLEFWREWLPKAATHGKCVIVIDGLNQLAEGLDHLHWLPQGQLPVGLKFIVSFRRGAPGSERLIETWRGPYYADKVQLAEVRPFVEQAHRRALVDAYLDQYLKALDDHLIEELISVEGAANPLFLKIVLSELRIFGSFEQLSLKIRTDFGTDPVSAFRAVLRRLISDPAYASLPSGQAVPVVFGALACARGGLSVAELSDILCRALGQTTPTEDQLRNAREAVLVILRQERPFLARRDGGYDFFYESFHTAAREAFCLETAEPPLTDASNPSRDADDTAATARRPPKHEHSASDMEGEASSESVPQRGVGDTQRFHLPDPFARPAREWHSLIADHHAAQPNANRRRLSELPHHLTHAERWDDLIGDNETAGPLTDLLFIQAKCEAGLVYELVTDYNAALAALPEFREENERNRLHDAAMFAYNKALREYAVVRCDWWFARRSGKKRREPGYPPLPPELRDGPKAAIPEEVFSRAARLRHFANFVTGNTSLLSQFAIDALPLASNWAEGPVAVEAEEYIRESRLLCFKRCPRPPVHPLRPQCVRTLEGHSDSVFSVSVSPDGRRAVSGSADKTVRLWDLETGACLRTFEGHSESVFSVSVSPDGRRAVSGSADNTVRLWDLDSGACLRTFIGHSHESKSVSVSSDGRRAVTRDTVWDLETGACLGMAFGSLYRIDSSVSPDGLCAISGSDIPDRTVEIWDLEKGACLRKFKGHSDAVVSVSVNPDGRRAISGSRDKTVRIWDLETGACLRTLEGHRGSVESVSVIPDGRRAISGSIDKTVRVWDLETGACPITLEDHSCEILRAVSFGKEGRRFVTVNDAEEHTDRLLEIVEAVTDERDEEDDEWEDDEVHSASVTPDNRRGVTGSSDGTVRLWDLETGACLRTLEGHGDAVHRVKVSPDGRRAISGSWDNTVRFWDLETGTCLRTGEDHANSVWIVKVSSDGRHSLSASSDKTIRLWDLKTGTCLCSFTGRNEGIWTGSVSLTPDGRYAVSGWSDQAVRLWDLGTGACLRTFEIRDCLVTSLSISPDSRYIMSGWSDWTIRLWDFKTGACLTVYHAGAAVYSVECSPNGNRVACETETGKIHLLTPVNFPPSGPLIVTAVRLWLFGEVTVKRRKPVADPGRWADHITCRCPHCGELFVPPKPVLEIGAEGAQVIRKGLWLPDSAYADPRLLAPCPHCGGALKFNPFVVDGRELG